MKAKIFFTAAFLFILISCSRQQKANVTAEKKNPDDWITEITEEKPKVYRYVNTADGIRIRSTPNGEKIGSLQQDTKVEIINESGKVEIIDNCYGQWVQIRTEEGLEGFVFSHYLSETLEEAEKFRQTECKESCLEKAAAWISEIETDLKHKGWNIAFYPSGNSDAMWTYEYSQGVTLVFYPRYDEETGRHADFLYQVICTENSDAINKIFPFKIGDPFSAVLKAFGEPYSNYQGQSFLMREGYYNLAYDLNLLTINCDNVYDIPEDYYTDGTVETIILTETGF